MEPTPFGRPLGRLVKLLWDGTGVVTIVQILYTRKAARANINVIHIRVRDRHPIPITQRVQFRFESLELFGAEFGAVEFHSPTASSIFAAFK